MGGSRFWLMAAACAVGILSGMGVGSAGLFVLYLTGMEGMAQAEAQGLNLIFYLFAAGASLLTSGGRHTVSPRLLRIMVVCAVPGAVLGSYLAGVMDASLLRRLFGGALILLGLKSLFFGRKTVTRRDAKKKI